MTTTTTTTTATTTKPVLDTVHSAQADPGDQMLALRNPFPADSRIVMNEEEHKYYLDGNKTFPISVSGVWSKKFPEFDAEGCIKRMYGAWARNPGSKYFQLIQYLKISLRMNDEAIKHEIAKYWQDNGNFQADLGTEMHRSIELYLNNANKDLSSDCTPEIQQFFTFFEKEICLRSWVPFRTEWSIFDEEFMVAGQIDSVFVDSGGSLHMVDWKRCKDKLNKDMNCWNRFGLGCCSHLPDHAFSHYCVQQNLYRLILKRNYGVVLQSMHLAQFHPSQREYNFVEVPVMEELALQLLEEERSVNAEASENVPNTINNVNEQESAVRLVGIF